MALIATLFQTDPATMLKALQYGALGLLALVLVGLYLLARDFMKQMKSQTEFTHEQLREMNAERAGYVDAWIEMSREWVKAMSGIHEELRAHNIQSMEIIEHLRKMNGKDRLK